MKLFFTVFLRAMKGHRRLLCSLGVISVLVSAIWVIEPLYAKYAIDELLKLSTGENVDVFGIFGIWAGLFLITNVIQGFNMFLRWSVQNRLEVATRELYYKHALELDIEHHVQQRSGELMKKIDTAAESMSILAQQILMEIPVSILTACAFYVISFAISWKLALITICMVPLYLTLVVLTIYWTRSNIEEVNRLWVRSIGRGYDAIANIFTVKSSAAEEREYKTMQDYNRKGIVTYDRVNIIWAILEGIGYFQLMRIVLIGAGIYLLAIGDITLGTLFFFQFSFFRLVIPMEMIARMAPRWNEKIDRVRLAEDIFSKDIQVQNTSDAHVPEGIQGSIEFQNVSFAYGSADALSDISLSIQPGEHLALVGHSGAGKSTMAALINRFYDVTHGVIQVDGSDLRELDVHWWRQQIGLVQQENIMFNDSVMNNIRYSRPSATDHDVVEAARRASAHMFIEHLPEQYETSIGERGIRLSGGERQRIAIARAILKNPSIVVLDEATSALDSTTEQAVQEGISELMKGKTSVIIAHRLSTVQSVDRIAVLHKGKLIACAKHKELLETCAIYREMVELQSHGMLAE